MRVHRFVWPLCFALWLCTAASYAQDFHDYGFVRSQYVAVQSSDEQPLLFPWAGGMNSVRFSTIDLNGDGIKDLVAFEKHGNRVLPFITEIHSDSVTYAYSPQFVERFPPLHDWLVLKDYDGDGLEDIFTYGLAGITVYRNTPDASGVRFQLVTDQLQSFYYNDSTNLFASPDDYLTIEDLDGDGDLDILNFWLLGKYVHYHRNYSMEDFGDAAHFAFRLEEECWGHFEEGAEDNTILLNSACGQKDEPTRHIGSTLFVRDISGNGLPDLLVGDVDFPNLIYLQNGGTIAEANMVALDTLFPSLETPVWLYSMPVVSFLDVDRDGVEEMIVSPSDPSLTKSKDHNSVWLYRVHPSLGSYERVSESFLQEEMVDVGSGARPVFYDWDDDGLLDLFVANFGSYDSSRLMQGFLTSYFSSSIAYYRNVGTRDNPAFRLITDDFGDLKRYGYQALQPAFGDLDGDGVTDLLFGLSDGTLWQCRNTASANAMPQFSSPVQMNNLDVGDYAVPQLFDLDRDAKNDLLIGNRRGRIFYYKDVSSSNVPSFQFVTDTLGGVDVRDAEISFFGYQVPFFYRDAQQRTILFCGNEQGTLCYYDSIDDNLDGIFRLRESALLEGQGGELRRIAEGIRSAPAVADLNADGYPDMVVGNFAGGLTLFEGTTPPPLAISQPPHSSSVKVWPNPATDFFCFEVDEANKGFLYLYDLSGRQLLSRSVEASSIKQDISFLPPGLYVGRVVSEKGTLHFKLVVKSR